MKINEILWMTWKLFSFTITWFIFFFCFTFCAFFFFFFLGCIGRGTLTFDEFCRVAVHFSEEDDEALQLSIVHAVDGMISTCHKWFVISHDINFSFFSSCLNIVYRKELKEAFRLYDKEGEKILKWIKNVRGFGANKSPFYGFSGNGYIPTSSLREILAALDDQLTNDQLNGKSMWWVLKGFSEMTYEKCNNFKVFLTFEVQFSNWT